MASRIDDVGVVLESREPVQGRRTKVVAKLEEDTGLTLSDMRHLWTQAESPALVQIRRTDGTLAPTRQLTFMDDALQLDPRKADVPIQLNGEFVVLRVSGR